MTTKNTSKLAPFAWTQKSGLRLESNSAGYTILDKQGRTVATFGPTEFGAALREWHRLNTAETAA